MADALRSGRSELTLIRVQVPASALFYQLHQIMAQSNASHRFEQATSKTSNRLLLWFSVGAVLLSLPLLINIVGRMDAEARMQTEVTRVTQKLAADEAKLAGLTKALDYAKSDAFTERWARVSARWGRDGEVVVVPPTSGETTHLWWDEFLK